MHNHGNGYFAKCSVLQDCNQITIQLLLLKIMKAQFFSVYFISTISKLVCSAFRLFPSISKLDCTDSKLYCVMSK